MAFISIENRIKIIKIYYENGWCVKSIFRKIRDIFGRHDQPSEHAIKNLVEKCRSTGSVHKIPITIRALTYYFWPVNGRSFTLYINKDAQHSHPNRVFYFESKKEVAHGKACTCDGQNIYHPLVLVQWQKWHCDPHANRISRNIAFMF